MKSKTSNNVPSNTSHNKPQISEDTHVQYIKGVGPARAKLLDKLGIRTLGNMLSFFPWRYEDRKNLKTISSLTSGSQETTAGRVVSTSVITTPRKRMKIFEIIIADETGQLQCRWFNQAYLKKYFPKDQKVILSGTVKGNPYSGFGLEMDNPDFELIGKEDKLVHTARIVPVYNATEGISVKQLRTLMFNTIESYSSLISEYMPEDIIKRNNLSPLSWAVREAHFPEEFIDITALNSGVSPAHNRLIFDEFFLLELGLAFLKKREAREKGISFKYSKTGLINDFMGNLPFNLTHAQERVINEIASDMKRDLPMNRLVHGDVGCGKTIVALVSILIAVENGYQTCLMAPTELLAEQHYINIHKMVEALGLNVALLTSSSKNKVLDDIRHYAPKLSATTCVG